VLGLKRVRIGKLWQGDLLGGKVIESIDEWIERTSVRLANLPRSRFSMWFAYVAERIMPHYEAFVRKHSWGDAPLLRQELDGIWSALGGGSTGPNAESLARLDLISPDGEVFDSPDSTYAQDVVICVDASVRALLANEELKGEWSWFAVEPVDTMACERITGYLSVEGEERTRVETQIVKDLDVAAFLADLDDLTDLLASDEEIDPELLRQRANKNQLNPCQYFDV
jgi:uncharacterized protein YjaG (DUF416 family)